MRNPQLAEIFYSIADILEMQAVQFKPQAYRKAARAIESLSEDVSEIYRKGGVKALKEIPGVGENISKKIEEFIKTGKIKHYDELKKKVPKHIADLMEVPGMGPRKIKVLHEKLGIKDLKGLEAAAKAGKIRRLAGFGEKSESEILKGLGILKKGEERMLLGLALPIIREVEEKLKSFKYVNKISSAGSVRRMKETIRDLDILITSDKPEKVMDFFTKLPAVQRVLAKGKTKSTVILKNGLQADVRVVDDDCYGSALQYFSGSKEHSIKLRSIAIKKGLKLSEYGVFKRKGNKRIAGKTEEGFYNALGMPYIEPEMRENTGEIEAAIARKLPKLVHYSSIKGDFHVHSNYSDGVNTIQEIAEAARRLKHEYVCIADHSKTQRIAHGIDEEGLMKKIKEMRKVNNKLKNFRVLAGAEVDILPNGELDYADDVLKKLDIIVAAVHSRFKSSKEEMTKRITTALQHKHVDIFAHPTGRLINRREPYDVDLKKVFKAAAENSKYLEINCFPERLDLKDIHVKSAIQSGLKLAIGTDSHNTNQLRFIELGVATARRGWAQKKDIINTYSLKELPKFFKKLKAE
jgi:DNA polymerase (family 10)